MSGKRQGGEGVGRGNATLLSAATSACCIYEILLSFRFNAGKHKWARGVAGLSQKALFGSNIVRHGYMPTEFAHCMCAREREKEKERESERAREAAVLQHSKQGCHLECH